jgi:methylmalonyl-CoA mutase N-terminal domain/subunit
MAEKSERKGSFQNHSGMEIARLYDASGLDGVNLHEDLGNPGEFPFTRGLYPSMYRGRLWTMRQYAGFGTPEESNERYRFLLARGQTGLSVAFDLPTQIGLDSDDRQSRGEVGKVGVAVDSLRDMEILFRDIPLDRVSVSMTINSTAAILLGMYLVLAEQRGISWNNLSGTIQNDILKEYVARGTYIFPPGPSMRITTDILAFCKNHAPQWNTMSISGYHIREAGATAVQELAFTLANAIAYVRAALEAGLDVDEFAPRLSFFLAAHNNLFEEVAKFRAARRVWAHVMRDTFHAKDPDSWKFRFHTQTSGVTLQASEPDNNVARVTLQALAAVLGGTQSLHTNSRDEALALPSRESAQIALRTQQIIAHESGVPDTVDPLGGSYFLENLTTRLEKAVRDYLTKIEHMGGAPAAIERGFIQQEIQDSAYEDQKKIDSRERIIVGLNAFASEHSRANFRLEYPPEELEQKQIRRLGELKKSRSQGGVSNRLRKLREAAHGGANLMPPLLEAIREMATLGEISDVLRTEFGTYRENVLI